MKYYTTSILGGWRGRFPSSFPPPFPEEVQHKWCNMITSSTILPTHVIDYLLCFPPKIADEFQSLEYQDAFFPDSFQIAMCNHHNSMTSFFSSKCLKVTILKAQISKFSWEGACHQTP